MYAIDSPALFEIQVRGHIDGQVTRNVWHYWLANVAVPIPDGEAHCSGLGLAFAGSIYTDYVAQLSSNWKCDFISTQQVLVLRHHAVQETPGDLGVAVEGAIAGPCEASGVAMRMGVAADLAGRQYVGGQWLPGIPVAAIVASQLTDVVFNAFVAMEIDWVAVLAAGGNNHFPVLCQRQKDKPHALIMPGIDRVITRAEPRRTVRYQRRREVGQGE